MPGAPSISYVCHPSRTGGLESTTNRIWQSRNLSILLSAPVARSHEGRTTLHPGNPDVCRAGVRLLSRTVSFSGLRWTLEWKLSQWRDTLPSHPGWFPGPNGRGSDGSFPGIFPNPDWPNAKCPGEKADPGTAAMPVQLMQGRPPGCREVSRAGNPACVPTGCPACYGPPIHHAHAFAVLEPSRPETCAMRAAIIRIRRSTLDRALREAPDQLFLEDQENQDQRHEDDRRPGGDQWHVRGPPLLEIEQSDRQRVVIRVDIDDQRQEKLVPGPNEEQQPQRADQWPGKREHHLPQDLPR